MREKINQWREFGLSSLAVNNRKTVYLIITIFLLGGISAYKNMPRESFPQIQVPEIYVNVPYPGNSPEIIADKIIKPFEKELNKLKGIEKITSTATQDFGILKIEFDFGITPKDAKRAVEEALQMQGLLKYLHKTCLLSQLYKKLTSMSFQSLISIFPGNTQ